VVPASIDALVARARDGDRRALARLLTRIDDGGPAARDAATRVAAHSGRAWVVGITGVPGSGKSTLVDALLGRWLGEGLTVAVIAVDPSSPISGGAVLGDRIRMGPNGAHPNAFIRSFSARGELGGLSRATRAAVDCFDAAGFDRVIVETVGTGQSETAIDSIADTRIVVCPPGLGDEVQALKAGTLEIADVLAVSKGDLPLAEQTAREMREMLTLRRHATEPAWRPEVLVISARAGTGLDALEAALTAHRASVGTGRRRRPLAPAASAGAASDVPSSARAGANLAASPRTTPHDPLDKNPSHRSTLARLIDLAARDGVCRTFGISVCDGGPGHAEVAMTVDDRHLNFNGGCHGGALFALADSAFGLASNSHGPVAVGIDAHITYQAAVGRGDTLVARATEIQRSRHIGVYRIDVFRIDGAGRETMVSAFTGTVFIKRDPAARARDIPEGTVP
jgi:LAO/AO transport system ATPase/phenylacetic acid degradation protein PaaD